MPKFWKRFSLSVTLAAQLGVAMPAVFAQQPTWHPHPSQSTPEYEPGRAHVSSSPTPCATAPNCPTPPPHHYPNTITPSTPGTINPNMPSTPGAINPNMPSTPGAINPNMPSTPGAINPNTPNTSDPMTPSQPGTTPAPVPVPDTTTNPADATPPTDLGDALSFNAPDAGSGPDAPNMMGDLLRSYRGVTFQYLLAGDQSLSNTSGAVTFRNSSIAENNSAIPRDRVFFRYNYFHNALDVRGLESAGTRDLGFTSIGLLPGQTAPNFDDPNTFRTSTNPSHTIFATGTQEAFNTPGGTGGNFDTINFNTLPLTVQQQIANQFVDTSNQVLIVVPPGTGAVDIRNLDPNLITPTPPTPITQTLVRPGARSYDVHLYTPGFEKTFLDGMASVEFRFPISQSINSDLDLRAGAIDPNTLFVPASPAATLGSSDVAFQDFQGIMKFVLMQSETTVISGGFGVTAPTGPDLNLRVTDFSNDEGTALNPRDPMFPQGFGFQSRGQAIDRRVRNFEVENETWEFSPFLAMALQPTERTFVNGFAQVDIPLNSSSWSYDSTNVDISSATGLVVGELITVVDQNNVPLGVVAFQPSGTSTDIGAVEDVERFSGKLEDQALLHLNLGGGYWLYKNPYNPVVNGIAAIGEIHYTTTLEDADRVTVPAKQLRANGPLQDRNGIEISPADPPEFQPIIGNNANRLDILNGTVGTSILLGNRASLSAAYVFPLRTDGPDKVFDGEANIQFNYYFGSGGINQPFNSPNF